MGVSEKVFEALKTGVLLTEKVSSLDDRVRRLDNDMREMNNRLIRLETLMEVAMNQPRALNQSKKLP
jgi:hypothetical protein